MKKTFFFVALSLFYIQEVDASSAIGYYSNGSLSGAESIIERKTAIHKLFLKRKRFFTTDEMHDVISEAADFVRLQYPTSELLQIGDLSNEKGGLASGHGSHQNGLDVDIVYLTRDGHLQSPEATFWEEEFVSNKGSVSNNFNTERNLMLFKHLVSRSPVGRIFVDVAIKKQLCQYAEKNGLLKDVMIKETLRRLRPEALHTNHFHMRITCPKDDNGCVSQSEVPTGTGCDGLSLMMDLATPSDVGC